MDGFFYKGRLAGVETAFCFRHPETARYFESWLAPCGPSGHAVKVPASDFQEWQEKWGRTDNPYTEFGLSVFRASDHLLPYGRCAFHSAAVLWRGRAILFTAPSGTGKTTQMKNWLKRFPGESAVINGDKPILSEEDDGILVWPSPWKGKERIGNDTLCAKLGGIVLLEQGSRNQLRLLQVREAVEPLMKRFLCTVEDRESVEAMCAMEEAVLSSVPVWKLVNTGEIESTELVREALEKEIGL